MIMFLSLIAVAGCLIAVFGSLMHDEPPLF